MLANKTAAEGENPRPFNVVALETGREAEPLRPGGGFRRRRLLWSAGAILIVLGLVAWQTLSSFWHKTLETAAVSRGPLTVVVAGTGSAQPVKQVNISSEATGTIRNVFVEHNQVVQAGDPLAELDTEKLVATVENTQAKLELAKVRAAETVVSEREKLAEYERKKALANIVSDREMQLVRFAYDRAVAQHAAALADIEIVRGELRLSEINLSRATIRSPVNGTVLRRNVEPGQFVVVSLQAPILFVIAEDLHHLEIRIDVHELDIDRIKPGQKSFFTFPALPGRSFSAEVHDVRLHPETVKGDTVYKTVLRIDNNEGLIRPGMSARADIVVQKIDDALLVPNLALEFSPSVFGTGLAGLWQLLFPKARPARRPSSAEPGKGTLWVVRDKALVAMPVAVGASDGRRTEILSDAIAPGQQVVTGFATGNR